MELTNKQLQGLHIATERYKNKEPYTVISGYAGTGKAQPIDTLIPTPMGLKKLGDLKIGDFVFDRQGFPTKILGVYPQGKLQNFILTLSDGRKTICGGDHIWKVFDKKNRAYEITTKQLLEKGLINSAGYKYAVPNNKPVQYQEIQYDIDPYVMGVFLGDGCCKQQQLTISSEDDEIPKYIAQLINAKDVIRNSENNYNWTFVLPEIIYDKNNSAYNKTKFQTEIFFSKYQKELCCKACDKRIPDIYKLGSVQQRLDLLQGLLDTDGSINSTDKNRFNVRFTSISENLINDVQEVLYSLGYSSSKHLDNRKDKYSTGKCFYLMINIPNEEKYKLFRLKRKKDIALKAKEYSKNKNYSKISIVDIQCCEESSEMVCIYVDNPEHLYLTNDFIVTHNTTLIKFIISALEIEPEKVAYITFTGKASEVLREKGCPNAMTAHKLLYYSRQMPNGNFIYKPRELLEQDYKIIVVDEVSMLPLDMWELLLSHGIYILACGDPFQLPSIKKDQDNHVLDHPHIFLDEVMRQAKESDIICLSMDIREGKKIIPLKGNDVQVFKRADLVDGMYFWADQIICATNKTRRDINEYMRESMQMGKTPKIGDKVICGRNCWKNLSIKEFNPLINGTIGYLEGIQIKEERYCCQRRYYYAPILEATIKTSNDIYEKIGIDYTSLLTGKKFFTPEQEYYIRRNKRNEEVPIEFDYGYAITCHRAQGSQWDKVLVIEESFPFKKEEHARWLYTALTRSAKKATVIINDE